MHNDFMILHIYSLGCISHTCESRMNMCETIGDLHLLNHFAIPNLINKSINLLYSNVFARVNGVCP